jgi:hypothetical protein
MVLAGQCWKQSVKASWEKLASVLEQLREAPAHVREAPRPRQARRPGQILALVVAVLADADGPMRGCDVRDAVIARLGEEVSWSTVGNALSYATAHAEFGVMRIGWGLYEKPGRS